MDRTSKIEVDQTEYQWRLLFASDYTLACNFAVYRPGSLAMMKLVHSVARVYSMI
jgi:hypothetical protein